MQRRRVSSVDEGFLSFNYDLISLVLSFVPTEELLRVQTVCRLWARILRDPVFVQTHCSRATPITASFTRRCLALGRKMHHDLRPFDGAKYPGCISAILSNGFKVVSRNHGIICFRRQAVFIVGNPAISYWSVIRFAPTTTSHDHCLNSSCDGRVALIYDPAISLNFKLVVVGTKSASKRRAKEIKYCIQFSIYSSETAAWTVSSEYTQSLLNLNPLADVGYGRRWKNILYEPCKSGGGSVCWKLDSLGLLVGYEISSDSYWKTQLPAAPLVYNYKATSQHMTSFDGIIYYTTMGRGVADVWRLQGKETWVWEGHACSSSSEELPPFHSVPVAYDRARRALLVGGPKYGEYFALHLSSSSSPSRLEIISQSAETPGDRFDTAQVAHCNTLARLDCSYGGIDGLQREFRWLGLDPLNLSTLL